MTKSEHSRWVSDPFTQQVFALLNEEIAEIKQAWADGQYVDQLINSQRRGVIEGINKILYMEVEDGE